MTRYAANIARLPGAAIAELRGDPAAAARCLAAAGLPAAEAPNRCIAAADGRRVLRLGPERWLVMAGADAEEALRSGLLAAAAAEPCLVGALVSDAFDGFAVGGAEAAEIMAQATPLDLSPRAFPESAASFTELWGTTSLVLRGAAGFEIWTDRALARYVAGWLAAAADIPEDALTT